jgi:hypothetical protein
MKSFIIFALLLSSTAWAAPVLNKNMAAEGTFVTIWPDHANPDHFYFAPNFMKIATDNGNNPKFHFTQYRSGSCDRRWDVRRGYCHSKALITSLMVAGYEEQQLAAAQAGIIKIRPKARFSAIPFLSSKVEFGSNLDEFIDQHECSPRAGQAADEIPCTITLNKRGITNLMPFLNSGRVLPFKFIYKISGVIEGANGQYTDEGLDYGLTVNLGGEILKKHPELDQPFLWEE